MFRVRDRHVDTCFHTAYLLSVSGRSAEHVSWVRWTLVTSLHCLTATCVWSISRACFVCEIDTFAPSPRCLYLQSAPVRSVEHVSWVRSTLVTSSHFLTAVCVWSISRACFVGEIDACHVFTLSNCSLCLVDQ